ncbi:PAS domain-containing protein [Tepidicaulis sp. LMO-SS28]|uniref:PAS domain-containing protein n=1 Tax=Tepidicaulis sp. LMO-SS28 TaxID=3447455 RepID=UPI003EE2FDB5
MKMRIGNIEEETDGINVTVLDAPDHEDVAALFDYWNEARGGNPMPRRADIDPVKIPRLLPFILIVDELPPTGKGRIRLFGTGLVELFGEDRTGTQFADIGRGRYDTMQEAVQQKWASVLTRTMETGAPVFAATRIISDEKSFLRLHIGAFPLTMEHQNGPQDGAQDSLKPPLSQILAIIRPS